MSNNEALSDVERIVLKVKEREKTATIAEKEPVWKSNAVQIAAKGVIGAAIGVAGGMILVTAAAVVGGAVLSWAAFASVLGIAGAAGGVSHGVVSSCSKNNK